ncbi:c-type cytochrome [Chryseobacterium sp.]|uniref:c-type cytochrome n=1 Tax=Chryseobacterium sp. TaxID=1871047 RepID=UPI00388E7A08
MRKIILTGIISLLIFSCSKKEQAVEQSSPIADVSTPVPTPVTGESLIEKSDCVGCHNATEKMIGPSYQEIAKKYPNTPENVSALADKIIGGNRDVWGSVQMPSHSTMSREDAMLIATSILSNN